MHDYTKLTHLVSRGLITTGKCMIPFMPQRWLVVIAQILTQDSHEALSPEYIRILAALGLPAVCRLSLVAVNAVMHEFLIVGFLVAEHGL